MIVLIASLLRDSVAQHKSDNLVETAYAGNIALGLETIDDSSLNDAIDTGLHLAIFSSIARMATSSWRGRVMCFATLSDTFPRLN
jgi:hypothetical protein